jgi:hypothetical protein
LNGWPVSWPARALIPGDAQVQAQAAELLDVLSLCQQGTPVRSFPLRTFSSISNGMSVGNAPPKWALPLVLGFWTAVWLLVLQKLWRSSRADQTRLAKTAAAECQAARVGT